MNASHSRHGWVPWFLLVVGVLIAGLWTVLLVSGDVTEIADGDRAIWFHLLAEFGTAVLLITSGTLALRGHIVGRRLAGIGLGALLYTTINSGGYYANRAEWAIVAMFGGLTAVSVVAAFRWLRQVAMGKDSQRPSHELDSVEAGTWT